jgi:hypothetical protein
MRAPTGSLTSSAGPIQAENLRTPHPQYHDQLDLQQYGQLAVKAPSTAPHLAWTTGTNSCSTLTRFQAQAQIGWDQFFHSCIAKAWQRPIAEYYKIRQPGESYTANQWMRSVIKELWELSIYIWKQQNTELHGTDSTISLEQCQKDTATEAENMYENTIGKVSPTDSIVLHHSPIDKIIKWSQEH